MRNSMHVKIDTKCLSTKHVLVKKGKRCNFTTENPGKYHPNQVIKEHIRSNRANQNYVPLDMMYSELLP